MCTDNPVRTRNLNSEASHASRDIGYYTHTHIYIYIVLFNINYNICNIYAYIYLTI